MLPSKELLPTPCGPPGPSRVHQCTGVGMAKWGHTPPLLPERKGQSPPPHWYTHALHSLLPSTMATLRAICWDHKKLEHNVGLGLLRQEGQKREAGRAGGGGNSTGEGGEGLREGEGVGFKALKSQQPPQAWHVQVRPSQIRWLDAWWEGQGLEGGTCLVGASELAWVTTEQKHDPQGKQKPQADLGGELMGPKPGSP